MYADCAECSENEWRKHMREMKLYTFLYLVDGAHQCIHTVRWYVRGRVFGCIRFCGVFGESAHMRSRALNVMYMVAVYIVKTSSHARRVGSLVIYAHQTFAFVYA